MGTSKTVDAVVEFYLGSRDFNGMPASQLAGQLGKGWRSTVRALVEKGRLEVRTDKSATNPHIKRLPSPTVATQLTALDEAEDLVHVCLYPHPSELAVRVDRAQYAGKPYDLALALGAAQLEQRAFDLKVLENYRNDPRYHYRCDDLHGSITITDEQYRDDKVPDRDKVVLETFGFGYGEDFGRAAVTFVRYLADLSPEHQTIWAAHQVDIAFQVHPDFYRTQIMGEWPQALSLCTAFFMELVTINKMAEAMGRPHLFRMTDRPKRFGFLLRPTAHEFEQFVHLLDKTMSDNLDQKFFQGEVDVEKERTRKEGKVQVERKGTIQVLEEWLRGKIPFDDDVEEMFAVFREVRRLRQAPAHALNDDAFDRSIFHKQRELLLRAYKAVRLLRLILANHPAASTVEVHPMLYRGNINSF